MSFQNTGPLLSSCRFVPIIGRILPGDTRSVTFNPALQAVSTQDSSRLRADPLPIPTSAANVCAETGEDGTNSAGAPKQRAERSDRAEWCYTGFLTLPIATRARATDTRSAATSISSGNREGPFSGHCRRPRTPIPTSHATPPPDG